MLYQTLVNEAISLVSDTFFYRSIMFILIQHLFHAFIGKWYHQYIDTAYGRLLKALMLLLCICNCDRIFAWNLISINRPSPENILIASTYLLKNLEIAKIPRNISIVKVLYQFATNARNLGAFQSAKNAFNIMREHYLVPSDLRCELGLRAMSSQVRAGIISIKSTLLKVYLCM